MRPFFSIIIPTHERPAPLSACLASLTRLDYPRERFEVIVVDDGSNSPLDDTVGAVRDRMEIQLIRQKNAGPAAARNRGAAAARGEFLAFTDDDCEPEPSWLRSFAEHLSSGPCQAVGGRTVNALNDNIYAAAGQLIVDYLYERFNSLTGEALFFTSNNLAIRAETYLNVGGFDTGFPRAAGEDREFCARWLRHGHGLRYVPEAVVRHSHHLGFAGFVRQQYNYGRGSCRYRRQCTSKGEKDSRLEAPGFYFQLLRYPFIRPDVRARVATGALFALSQAAITAGYARELLSRPR
jgi:glycosyltransferase involved in cell wall biosynthesis